MLRPYTDACPSPIHLQVLPRDQSVRFQVPPSGRLDDLRRQRRRRRVAVPLPLLLQAREVVAQRLLVEARLAPPWLVAVHRPEARRVGREDLVLHDQPPVGGGGGWGRGGGSSSRLVVPCAVHIPAQPCVTPAP